MLRITSLGGALAAVSLATASIGCGSNVAVSSESGTTMAGGGGEGGQSSTATPAGGAGGTTSTSSSEGAGGQTSTSSSGCVDDAGCAGSVEDPYCDVASGQCVECLPEVGGCPEAVCDPDTFHCVGCLSDIDCADPGAPVCSVLTKTCVACLPGGADCEPGEVCDEASLSCVPGCDENHACGPGLSCCFGACFNTSEDPSHCGGCNVACEVSLDTVFACVNESCVLAGCGENHADCNGYSGDGCEQNTLVDGPCLCVPGFSQSCYLGAPGTLDVGLCHAGQQFCEPGGTAWGPCENQGLPAAEVCANGLDEDCDGIADETEDADGDGWSKCDNDCNDLNPRINPGALEVTYTLVDDDNDPGTPPIIVSMGNGFDDDCDPTTADVGPPESCSAAALFSGVTALDLAHALDLCRSTTANPPKSQRTWGLISAELLRPDGTPPAAAQLADFQNNQTAVLADYGAILPRRGATLAGLSTGRMRDQNDAGHVAPSPGTDFGWSGSAPPVFLAAHPGGLPASLGCNGNCPGGSGADDGVLLRLKLRVPTNAKALSVDQRFFSAEYPGDVCTGKNDFALALLGSAANGLPPDRNVVFDGLANPLSVSNAFFDVCAPTGCYSCPKGSGDLAGTGMPAGTSWHTSDMPVVPGETMTLDLTVFDVSGGAGDSVVLFDHFRYFGYSGFINEPHP